MPNLAKIWIARAKEKSGPTINLVLAKDDILNEKSHDEEISKLEHIMDKNQLIVTDRGGHFGFIITPWFKTLLAAKLMQMSNGASPSNSCTSLF